MLLKIVDFPVRFITSIVMYPFVVEACALRIAQPLVRKFAEAFVEVDILAITLSPERTPVTAQSYEAVVVANCAVLALISSQDPAISCVIDGRFALFPTLIPPPNCVKTVSIPAPRGLTSLVTGFEGAESTNTVTTIDVARATTVEVNIFLIMCV